MKRVVVAITSAVMTFAAFFVFGTLPAHAAYNWNLDGDYNLQFSCADPSTCSGGPYLHTMHITNMDANTGAFTGSGSTGDNSINWTISGTETNSDVSYTLTYLDGNGNPTSYTVNATGQVNGDGSWTGTARSTVGQDLNFFTTHGAATPAGNTTPAANLNGVYTLSLCRDLACNVSEVDTLHISSMDMSTGEFLASGFNNNDPYLEITTRNTLNDFAPFADFQTGREVGNQVSFDLVYTDDSNEPQPAAIPVSLHGFGTIDSTGALSGDLYTTDAFNPQRVGSFSTAGGASSFVAPARPLSGNYSLVFTPNGCTSNCPQYTHFMTFNQSTAMDMATGQFFATGHTTDNSVSWRLAGQEIDSNFSFLYEDIGNSYHLTATGVVDATGRLSGTAHDSSGGVLNFTSTILPPPTYRFIPGTYYTLRFNCTAGCLGTWGHTWVINTFTYDGTAPNATLTATDVNTNATISGYEAGDSLVLSYQTSPSYVLNLTSLVDTNGVLMGGHASASGQSFNVDGSPLITPTYELVPNNNYVVNFQCTGGCSGTYAHTFHIVNFNMANGSFTATDGSASVTGDISGTSVWFSLDYHNGYVVNGTGVLDANGLMAGPNHSNGSTDATAPGQTFWWYSTTPALRIN